MNFYKVSGIYTTLIRFVAPGFISADFAAGHEVYFLFDISRSITDLSLNISLQFAHNLVRRVRICFY